MNGIHDMGGMHGFGPVQPEANEPVFHAGWEARMYALSRAMGPWKLGSGRRRIEQLPPADYLRMSYYEKWLASLVGGVLDTGLVTAEEIATGHAAPGSVKATPPLTADKVAAVLAAGSPSQRATSTNPRFAPGASVRAKNINPAGHTRLPRYVRGRVGVIEREHGAHVFPDTNARNEGEHPQTLYTVRFAARELWGDAANAADTVHLEMWDDYLDPA